MGDYEKKDSVFEIEDKLLSAPINAHKCAVEKDLVHQQDSDFFFFFISFEPSILH